MSFVEHRPAIQHVFDILSQDHDPNDPYYAETKKAFPNLIVGDKCVYRLNHGLPHTLSGLQITRPVIDYYRWNGTEEMQQAMSNIDAYKLECLALFSSVGRESEVDFHDDPEKHKEYRQAAGELFEAFYKEKGIFSQEEFARYKRILIHMGDLKSPDAEDPIHVVLNTVHKLDLYRCRYKIKDPCYSSKETIEKYILQHSVDITQDANAEQALIALIDYAQACILSRGDRLPERAQYEYDEALFVKCSTDIDFCLEKLGEIPLPDFKAIARGEWHAPQITHVGKVIRADEQDYFLSFLDGVIKTGYGYETKWCQLRRGIHKPWIITATGEVAHKSTKEPTFTSDQKRQYSQSQPVFPIADNDPPAAIIFDEFGPAVGVIMRNVPENVLTKHRFYWDVNSTVMPYECVDETAAQNKRERWVTRQKLFTSETAQCHYMQSLEAHNIFPENLAKLRWIPTGKWQIAIFRDDLESRLLAQVRARMFSEALKRKGIDSDADIPICFYVPGKTGKVLSPYTTEAQQQDRARANSIFWESAEYQKKCQQGKFEFLLAIAEPDFLLAQLLELFADDFLFDFIIKSGKTHLLIYFGFILNLHDREMLERKFSQITDPNKLHILFVLAAYTGSVESVEFLVNQYRSQKEKSDLQRFLQAIIDDDLQSFEDVFDPFDLKSHGVKIALRLALKYKRLTLLPYFYDTQSIFDLALADAKLLLPLFVKDIVPHQVARAAKIISDENRLRHKPQNAFDDIDRQAAILRKISKFDPTVIDDLKQLPVELRSSLLPTALRLALALKYTESAVLDFLLNAVGVEAIFQLDYSGVALLDCVADADDSNVIKAIRKKLDAYETGFRQKKRRTQEGIQWGLNNYQAVSGTFWYASILLNVYKGDVKQLLPLLLNRREKSAAISVQFLNAILESDEAVLKQLLSRVHVTSPLMKVGLDIAAQMKFAQLARILIMNKRGPCFSESQKIQFLQICFREKDTSFTRVFARQLYTDNRLDPSLPTQLKPLIVFIHNLPKLEEQAAINAYRGMCHSVGVHQSTVSKSQAITLGQIKEYTAFMAVKLGYCELLKEILSQQNHAQLQRLLSVKDYANRTLSEVAHVYEQGNIEQLIDAFKNEAYFAEQDPIFPMDMDLDAYEEKPPNNTLALSA